jgi:Holliday junction resolvasome RuvABC DNA-binding subunit
VSIDELVPILSRDDPVKAKSARAALERLGYTPVDIRRAQAEYETSVDFYAAQADQEDFDDYEDDEDDEDDET